MIKNEQYIIALDLDECLLNSKRELSQRSKRILEECKNKGHIIAISSTRGYGSCKKIVDEIGADYVCCQAGNMIVDGTGNIVYKHSFSKKQVSDFVGFVKKYTNNVMIDSDVQLFGGIGDDFAKSWGAIPCELNDFITKNVYKFCVNFKPEFKKEIEDYCAEKHYVCRVMRGFDFLLIVQENSDKFFALKKLTEMHKTDLNHLVVFGDDHSDLLSIQKAKYGVAVANAKQEVLDAADYVTDTNDNDGVAAFLEKNF